MNLNREDLKGSCSQLAQSFANSTRQMSTSHVRQLSASLYTLASRKAQDLHAADKDVEVVNRAVWYISLVHSASPPQSQIDWFQELLDALLDLAFPPSPTSMTITQKFLQDLLLGTSSAVPTPKEIPPPEVPIYQGRTKLQLVPFSKAHPHQQL